MRLKQLRRETQSVVLFRLVKGQVRRASCGIGRANGGESYGGHD